MYNPTKILIDNFVSHLTDGYKKTYGGLKKNYCEIIAWAGNMSLEIIANSNALYHNVNVEHTILVTLVGQEILRGVHIKDGGVACEDWLNTIISLLFHDIGYVKGVCKMDNSNKNEFATGKSKDEVVKLPEGSTDAGLAPYHVDRGKLFIDERFGRHSIIDVEQVKRNLELTKFPVPAKNEHANVFTQPEIVRAADLIGQLGDQRYLQKCTCLYYEFEEIGTNKILGYKSPKDLVVNYPSFFWKSVYKYISKALMYLNLTIEGKFYVASLYSNVFSVEHAPEIKSALLKSTSSTPVKKVVYPSYAPKTAPIDKRRDGKKKKAVRKKKKKTGSGTFKREGSKLLKTVTMSLDFDN